MKYDLIALDVDGTLLNDRHELTAKTIETVGQAARSGAAVVLCTGRGPNNSIPLLEQMGLTGVTINHNGAVTVDSAGPRVLAEIPIDLSALDGVIDWCRRHGVHFNLCSAFHLYVETMTEEAMRIYRNFLLEPIQVDDVKSVDDSIVKMTIAGNPEMIDRVEAEWPELGCPLVPVRSAGEALDAMDKRATKGNALKKLAARLGIPRERVMAVGNYYNDVEMLQWAGLGVAMANSPDEVKRAADRVTGSNNEDGAAEAILRWCLS